MLIKNAATFFFFLGMLEASRSFVKIQNTSQTKGESCETMHVEKMQLEKSNEVAVSLSRVSLEANVLASEPNQSIVGAGLDTLEEQEGKEMFFAKLEREASSTIDYSRLNKELDSNDSVMLAPFLRQTEKTNPIINQKNEEKFTLMLQSDVSQNRKFCSVSYEPAFFIGTSYEQTTSDMEALHQAYRHIDQSLGDTDEQKLHDPAAAVSEYIVQGVSQSNDVCSKGMSTIESDLPTVEELMKPIKGYSCNVRNFDVAHESLKFVLNKCALSQALQSCSLKNERSESMTTKPALYKNIRSPAPIHKKKSSYGPHGVVRSSGYGKPNSLSKQCFPVNEKKTPKETFKKTNMKTGPNTDPWGTPLVTGLQLDTEPLSTTLCDLSFSPIKSCDRELYLLKRVQVAEEELNTARDLIQQLTSTVSQKEEEMETKIVELKTQHEKELAQLGQENYVLQTKLRSMEELTQEKRRTYHTAAVPITEEKLAQIQKEIADQEIIIQGYQQENEKLYKQMKQLQIQNKKNEEQMFKENQCVMSELIALREKVEKTNIQARIVQDSEPAKNQSFTELISELRAAQKEETKLQEEIRRLKQDKQALEVDLGQAKKERDLAKAQIASISGEKSYEFKVKEESYKQEITHLKRKLEWYAENQDLLDKDAARLKDARKEIEKLNLEVEKLRAEAGDQCVQQKKRLRDRAADAKRIQDLERQISEMEGILKRRYPNSLPALIYAAAAAEKTNDLSAKPNTVDFLERRIKKLEAELEGKDDEAKKSLRAMEQQFQKVKVKVGGLFSSLLTSRSSSSNPPAMSNPTLNAARDEAFTTSLGNPFQGPTTLTVKNFFLRSNLNLPCLSLNPLPLVLSPQSLMKSPSPLSQHVAEVRQTQEVEKWRRLTQRKNQELERFRVELDSILDVLRELQKQGVVIPAPNSRGFSMRDSCWKT
uniref:Centrosomal protein of 162 kDa n=1 Tax=Amazona collaria TaxID=241587 RepID=A0A8B9IRE5_9PSIT